MRVLSITFQEKENRENQRQSTKVTCNQTTSLFDVVYQVRTKAKVTILFYFFEVF